MEYNYNQNNQPFNLNSGGNNGGNKRPGCGRILGIAFLVLLGFEFFMFFCSTADALGFWNTVLLLAVGAIALLFFVLGAPYSFWGWRR